MAFLLGTFYSAPAPADSDALQAAGINQFMGKEAKCLLSGEALLNLKQVNYSLYELGTNPDDPCSWAGMSEWREINAPVIPFIGSEGRWQTRLFVSGPRRLMLVFDLDNPGWLGAAFFQSEGIFRDYSGDAPGRDPGQWPRPVNCKRVLHAMGDGIEAAWYRTSESPASAIRQVGRAFSSAGWEIVFFGDMVLCAMGKTGIEVTLFAGQENESTYLMVTSASAAI